MLTEAVNHNSKYPAAQRNESAEENHGNQVNVMLRLLTGNTGHRRIGSHQSRARHHTEDDHTNARERAHHLGYLTKSTNAPGQSVTFYISRNRLGALVYGSYCRCCHPAWVCITPIQQMQEKRTANPLCVHRHGAVDIAVPQALLCCQFDLYFPSHKIRTTQSPFFSTTSSQKVFRPFAPSRKFKLSASAAAASQSPE